MAPTTPYKHPLWMLIVNVRQASLGWLGGGNDGPETLKMPSSRISVKNSSRELRVSWSGL
jgi:hypothetical protein